MLVYIRGAGVMASGIAMRLYRAGCRIVMSDLEHPLALRRTVCFSEAIRRGSVNIGGVEAAAAKDPEEAIRILRQNRIAVMKDPEGNLRGTLPFEACVAAVSAEAEIKSSVQDAPVVIGVGGSFRPGGNCHAAVCADPGGPLGWVSYEAGEADGKRQSERRAVQQAEYIAAPRGGIFYPVSEIGDPVRRGETVAVIDNDPVISHAAGYITGILCDGDHVLRGQNCCEIMSFFDPVGCRIVSDEDLAVGGGVLEALMHFRETF
ncbi:MAG: molybdenum hydroxylase [Eubacterium sp.]|nr:molybdenum hydroxylase [Eubacterium sp.]MCF0259729.1 hypothetical protein [Erysipelotrichaceae bacterium]